MDQLIKLIEESKKWALVDRARELLPLVSPLLIDLFNVDCGFFVYRRRIIEPSRPLVYCPFGVFANEEDRLQAELDLGRWFYHIQDAVSFETWIEISHLPKQWQEIFFECGVQQTGIWPIRFGEETVGAMVFGRTRSMPADDSSTIGSVATLFSLILNLVVARRLAEINSQKDLLTGLWNRRGFESSWLRWSEDAKRRGQSILLGILDLDNFKQINDELGHITGDNMLVKLANHLNSAVGEHGLACRWGGDEFVFAYCTSANLDQAQTELLAALCRFGQPLSVGIALFEKDGSDLEECLHIADQRMYENKQGTVVNG